MNGSVQFRQIPSRFLHSECLHISKQSDLKPILKEINAMISTFSDVSQWTAPQSQFPSSTGHNTYSPSSKNQSDISAIFSNLLAQYQDLQDTFESHVAFPQTKENLCILLCSLVQILNYEFPEGACDFLAILTLISESISTQSKIASPSTIYLLELLRDLLLKSPEDQFFISTTTTEQSRSTTHQDVITEILNALILIEINAPSHNNDTQEIVSTNNIDQSTPQTGLIASVICAALKSSTARRDYFASSIIYLFSRSKKAVSSGSAWRLAKSIARHLSSSSANEELKHAISDLIQFAIEILQFGNKQIDASLALDFILQIHKQAPHLASDAIRWIHSMLLLSTHSNKQPNQINNNPKKSSAINFKPSQNSQSSYQIEIKPLYAFLGRVLASKKNGGNTNSSNANLMMMTSTLSSASQILLCESAKYVIEAMTQNKSNLTSVERFELAKYLVKFIRVHQNYAILKKAPLSIPSEKFQLSNTVVKAESSLLGLLDTQAKPQGFSPEESNKLVDLIHDVAIQDFDAFSSFFYEEFLRMFVCTQALSVSPSSTATSRNASSDIAENALAQNKRCLSDMYYFICSRVFCEEELLDLVAGSSDERLSSTMQRTVTRASTFFSLVLHAIFVEPTTSLSKQHAYQLVDLQQAIMSPSMITKYNPIQAFIGFVYNAYESFHSSTPTDVITIKEQTPPVTSAVAAATSISSSTACKLADTKHLDDFILKNIGSQWSFESQIFKKNKSALMMLGIRDSLKSQILTSLHFSRLLSQQPVQPRETIELAAAFLSKRFKSKQNPGTYSSTAIDTFITTIISNRVAISKILSQIRKVSYNNNNNNTNNSNQTLTNNGKFGSPHAFETTNNKSQEFTQQIATALIQIENINPTCFKPFSHFIKVALHGFLTPDTICYLFSESCSRFLSGNIAGSESLLCILLLIRKIERKHIHDHSESLFSLTTVCRITEFFLNHYADMKCLTQKYPGKVNLKPRQLRLIVTWVHFLSLFETISSAYPDKRNPDKLVELLQKDLSTATSICTSTTKSTKHVVRIIYNVNAITSNNPFESMLRNAQMNLVKHPTQFSQNTTILALATTKQVLSTQYLDSKHKNQPAIQLENILDNLIASASEVFSKQRLWNTPNTIGAESLLLIRLIKTIRNIFTSSTATIHSSNEQLKLKYVNFLHLILKSLARKSSADDVSLKITSIQSLLAISSITKKQSLFNSHRISSSTSTAVATPTTTSASLKSSDKLLNQLFVASCDMSAQTLVNLMLTSISDSESIVRKICFDKIVRHLNYIWMPMPSAFLHLLHIFTHDTEESLSVLSKSILRTYAEKQQATYYSSSTTTTTTREPIEKSLQYSIIFVLFYFINHPMLAVSVQNVNSSASQSTPCDWKIVQRMLWESLDVFLVSKSAYPESFAILSSIVLRLKQVAKPVIYYSTNASSFDERIVVRNMKNSTLGAQNGGKILSTELLGAISKEGSGIRSTTVEQQSQVRFEILCDLCVDFIIQKWIAFKRDAPLVTIKVDFILPNGFFSFIENTPSHVVDHQLTASTSSLTSSSQIMKSAAMLPNGISAFESVSLSQANEKATKNRNMQAESSSYHTNIMNSSIKTTTSTAGSLKNQEKSSNEPKKEEQQQLMKQIKQPGSVKISVDSKSQQQQQQSQENSQSSLESNSSSTQFGKKNKKQQSQEHSVLPQKKKSTIQQSTLLAFTANKVLKRIQ